MKRNNLGQFKKLFNTWILRGDKAVTKIHSFEVTIDATDLPLVEKIRWSLSIVGVCKYAVSNIKINGKYKHIRMHRFILNPPKNMEVDHKDNNGLNNCRINLRVTEMSFNKKNLTRYKTNTSGFKGVHLVNGNRWAARIQVDYKRIPLGCYGTKIEAALAYNAAAIKYFGEFAHLNIIP